MICSISCSVCRPMPYISLELISTNYFYHVKYCSHQIKLLSFRYFCCNPPVAGPNFSVYSLPYASKLCLYEACAMLQIHNHLTVPTWKVGNCNGRDLQQAPISGICAWCSLRCQSTLCLNSVLAAFLYGIRSIAMVMA